MPGRKIDMTQGFLACTQHRLWEMAKSLSDLRRRNYPQAQMVDLELLDAWIRLHQALIALDRAEKKLLKPQAQPA